MASHDSNFQGSINEINDFSTSLCYNAPIKRRGFLKTLGLVTTQPQAIAGAAGKLAAQGTASAANALIGNIIETHSTASDFIG